MRDSAKPRYSFVIPAFNEEAVLGRTLDAIHESAACLTGGFEIVVANDDSSDRTPEIAREKGAHVIDVKKRQIAAVRNAGASIATGEILVFVDADTLVTKQTLLAMEKLLGRPDIVGGGAQMDFDVYPPLWGLIVARVFTFFYFNVGRLAGGAFLFARREAFDKAGGWDERFFASEEIHLSRALKRLGKFRIIRAPVITSARKFRMKSGREHLAVLLHVARKGFKGLESREGLDMWYDGTREKQPRDAPARLADGNFGALPEETQQSLSYSHLQRCRRHSFMKCSEKVSTMRKFKSTALVVLFAALGATSVYAQGQSSGEDTQHQTPQNQQQQQSSSQSKQAGQATAPSAASTSKETSASASSSDSTKYGQAQSISGQASQHQSSTASSTQPAQEQSQHRYAASTNSQPSTAAQPKSSGSPGQTSTASGQNSTAQPSATPRASSSASASGSSGQSQSKSGETSEAPSKSSAQGGQSSQQGSTSQAPQRNPNDAFKSETSTTGRISTGDSAADHNGAAQNQNSGEQK